MRSKKRDGEKKDVQLFVSTFQLQTVICLSVSWCVNCENFEDEKRVPLQIQASKVLLEVIFKLFGWNILIPFVLKACYSSVLDGFSCGRVCKI